MGENAVKQRLSIRNSDNNLKAFLNEGLDGNFDINSKPLADLFLDCTVLFGDISGFTAWSSVREPSQVFTLLETIYSAFDQIAKKRRIFKVETVRFVFRPLSMFDRSMSCSLSTFLSL